MPIFAIHASGPTKEFQTYGEAEAFVWREIKAGQRWSVSRTKPGAPANPTSKDHHEAARRVAEGIFAAMGPDRSGGYVVPAIEGPGIGSYERAQMALSGVADIQLQDRRDTLARCRAAFEVSIARPFLQAAE